MSLQTKNPTRCFACEHSELSSPVPAKYVDSTDIMLFYECDRCKSLTAECMDRSTLYSRDQENTNFDEKAGILTKLKSIIINFTVNRLAQRITHKGHALDYGCGSGELANILCDVFEDVTAADVQETRPSGLDSRVVFESIPLSTKQKFDLITARHVLEHVDNPKAVIEELSNMLTQTGVLHIEVPNARSAFRPMMKDKWAGYFTPYHVGVFDPNAFDIIAEELQLEIVHRKAETATFGLTLMHVGFGRNLARFVAFSVYPLQMLINRVYGTSEAIVCEFRKSV